MVEAAVIAGSVGVLVAGLVTSYTLWQRRLASSLQRVPVRTGPDARRREEGLH
jgi:hypothetical protein